MNLCPSCNHQANLHINGMCSVGKCYCTEGVPIEIASNAQWFDVLHVNGDQLTLDDGHKHSEAWERGKGTMTITVSDHGLEGGEKICLAILAIKR